MQNSTKMMFHFCFFFVLLVRRTRVSYNTATLLVLSFSCRMLYHAVLKLFHSFLCAAATDRLARHLTLCSFVPHDPLYDNGFLISNLFLPLLFQHTLCHLIRIGLHLLGLQCCRIAAIRLQTDDYNVESCSPMISAGIQYAPCDAF